MLDGSTAYAFNKSDGSRDSSKDISIGSGSWTGIALRMTARLYGL